MTVSGAPPGGAAPGAAGSSAPPTPEGPQGPEQPEDVDIFELPADLWDEQRDCCGD